MSLRVYHLDLTHLPICKAQHVQAAESAVRRTAPIVRSASHHTVSQNINELGHDTSPSTQYVHRTRLPYTQQGDAST